MPTDDDPLKYKIKAEKSVGSLQGVSGHHITCGIRGGLGDLLHEYVKGIVYSTTVDRRIS